jgi:hypothetical protein
MYSLRNRPEMLWRHRPESNNDHYVEVQASLLTPTDDHSG